MIGKRLKQLRKAERITQQELAEQLGVTSVTISRWETGARQPPLEALHNLAEFFVVSVGYLLGEETMAMTGHESHLIYLWRRRSYDKLLSLVSDAIRNDDAITDRSGWSVRSAGWYSDNSAEGRGNEDSDY